MHLEPGDALLGGDKGATGLRLLLLLGVVLTNSALSTWSVQLVLFIAGGLMLWFEASRSIHVRLAVGGVVWCGVLAGGIGILSGDTDTAATVGLRMSVGTVWALWFGATVRWSVLKARLRACRLPAVMLDTIDLSIAHTLILGLELRRRWEAAWVRHGLQIGQPRLQTCAAVLAGGIEVAFDRAVRLEEARQLRGGSGGSRQTHVDAKEARDMSDQEGTKRMDQDPARQLVLRLLDAVYPDGTLALSRIDLTVEAGEWVAVAGPSGSGKSSLLRIAAGLMAVSDGEMFRFGMLSGRGPLRDRLDPRISLVFQDPNDQLFGSTPLEDVAWGLMRTGLSEEAAFESALHALDALGVAHLGSRPVHRLSFGERKRVAFAAALVTRPELLLCDEPTSGLDPVASMRLIANLEAAGAHRPVTVLWATHDLEALPLRVSRVVLLNEGRVVFDGPRERALQPETLARAGLLTSPPSLDAASTLLSPVSRLEVVPVFGRAPSEDQATHSCVRSDCPANRGSP